MTGFKNFSELGTAAESRLHISNWRKQPIYTTATATWYDLSITPGNPNPIYYASTPLVSAQLARSTNGGINHGPNAPSGMGKYLLRSTFITTAQAAFTGILCDYLMYYPFVDQSVTTEQTMTNSVTIPRYTTGAGVRILPIIVAPAASYTLFTVKYTNQDGTTGRTTPTIRGNIGNVNGYVLGSYAGSNLGSFAGPFLPLQAGDTGVRAIESVTFSTTDVGLVTFILVKPLCNLSFYDNTGAAERTQGLDFTNLPKIEDDACLNYTIFAGGNISTVNGYSGIIETITN